MVRVPCDACLKHVGRIGAAGICIVAGYFLIFQTNSKLSKNVIPVPDKFLCPALIRQVVGGVVMLASVLMMTGGYHPKLTKLWIFLMTVAIACMVVMEAIFYVTPSMPLPKLGLGVSMFGGFYTFVGYETYNTKIRVIGRIIFALPLVFGAAIDAWEMLGAHLHFDMKNLFLLLGIVAGVVSGIGLALGQKVHVCSVFMCVYLFHEAMEHLVEMTIYQHANDADVSTEEFVLMWRCLVLTFIAIALYGHDKLIGEDNLVNNSNWKSSSAKRIHPGKVSKFDTCMNYFMKYFGRLLFAGMVGVGGYCLLFLPEGRAVLNPESPPLLCQIMGVVALIGGLLALPGLKQMSICWVLPTMATALYMGVFQAIYPSRGFAWSNGLVNISMIGGIFMLAGYERDNNCERLFGRVAFAAPIIYQAGFYTYSVTQLDIRYDMDFAFKVLSECVGVIGGSLVAAGLKTHVGAFFLSGYFFHESMEHVVTALTYPAEESAHSPYTSLILNDYMFTAKYLLLLGMAMALFGHDRMHEETVRITGDSKWSQKLETGLLSNRQKQSAD